ncbi:MAG: hypothetical protein Q7S04_00250 [Candidatus Moranbacteria bacterium]|nr:hypothetical protein [Candidatus Moranbacteria bacterium]
MNKLYRYAFLFVVLAVGLPVHAQVADNTAAKTGVSEIMQEEAEGKAIWDKLQNKQINCKDVEDDGFDVLGEFFFGNMMGISHDTMNKMMEQRLGKEGEKQMHIAMGKRLSGCETAAAFPQGASYFAPMMGFGNMMGNNVGNVSSGTRGTWAGGMMGYGYGNNLSGGFGFLCLLTWGALLTFLALGSAFFWKGLKK